MAEIVGERVRPGDAIVDYEEKVFPDIQAEPGEKAYVFIHSVPFESSVSLVNLLTATRLVRKGFDVSIILFGPGSLIASATRGFPKVGDEAFPGHLNINKQLQTIMDEGGKVYACRFSAAALYGMRETDFMEGVKPIHPRDVLDAALQAYREKAFVMNTWNL
ncbi:MAG TPA: MSMEG_0572/Sll0783 family nitrogen starvation response protein [Actinomycetota bacterium]|nr:MSMEG_0572/Sll0783 family nitrogen starvation response protein [Actinomycetota bacterium]